MPSFNNYNFEYSYTLYYPDFINKKIETLVQQFIKHTHLAAVDQNSKPHFLFQHYIVFN